MITQFGSAYFAGSNFFTKISNGILKQSTSHSSNKAVCRDVLLTDPLVKNNATVACTVV